MAAPALDPKKIFFDPVAALTTIGELGAWGPTLDASGKRRARMDMQLYGQALLLVMTEAELVASIALNQVPAIVNGVPQGIVLGERYAAMKALPAGPFRDGYLATMALARSIPDAIEPARKNDVEFIPSGAIKAAVLRQQGAGLVWQVAAVGIPLAAIAAIAYWAGKREDAQASVQIATLASTVSMDAALKYSLAEIAAGQPVDPAVIASFDAAGRGKEDARSWAVPVAAVVLALGGLIGGYAAVKTASGPSKPEPKAAVAT
jgi:hypothetical protein